MTCECGSDRIIEVGGKTSDMCGASFSNGDDVDVSNHGYVPRELGIGGGDYLEFDVCADCGKIQNWQKLDDETIIEAIKSM